MQAFTRQGRPLPYPVRNGVQRHVLLLHGLRRLFFPAGSPFAAGDQFEQTLVDVKTPGTRTVAVAFEGRNQANVREAELSPAILRGNLKDNVSTGPLGLIFEGAELAVRGMPDDFLARHEFGDFMGAAMNVT